MTCSSDSGPRRSSSSTVVSPRKAPISTTRLAPAAVRTGSTIVFQRGYKRYGAAEEELM